MTINLTTKEVIGFLLAPLITNIFLIVYTVLTKESLQFYQLLYSFIVMILLSYGCTFSVSLYMYWRYVQKSKKSALRVVLLGIASGVIYVSLFYIPIILTNIQYGSEHLYALLKNYAGLYLFAIIYSCVTSLLFWYIINIGANR